MMRIVLIIAGVLLVAVGVFAGMPFLRSARAYAAGCADSLRAVTLG